MKNVEFNDVRMIARVVGVCNKHSDLVDANARMRRTVDDVLEVQTELKTAIKSQAGLMAGVTSDKEGKKENLIDEAMEFSSVLCGYAEKNNDAGVLAIADVERSDLESMKEPELVTVCTTLHDTAQGVIENLEEFGVDEDGLYDFEVLIDVFANAIDESGTLQSERTAATASIPVLIRKAKRIMRIRLDKQVRNKKKERPEFVLSYKNARKIKHYGIRHEDEIPDEEVLKVIEAEEKGE